jgi:hypothetical protein|tara:strand:- start:206 stop:574 length:369 start_codon:yes stop_codon:yes gene_type:complete
MVDKNTGRPNHIEDALIRLHKRQWFTWTDSENKIYANLRLTEKVGISGNIVDNPVTELPTESEVNAKLKELQDAWDLQNDSYKSKRRAEYPSIADQLDDIYHNGIDGWKATIKTTKDKYAKD